jgi:NAD(P)-dependent dehydrogenase (short-subunit alcohol dehydrogenase family)
MSRVVVVTGGASGIGRGIALAFARRGDDIAICDVHEERLASTVAELEALGVGALGRRCDVSSDADVEAFRDAVLDRFGRVDVLCNNAGVAVMGPPETVELADWEWILQINVLGLVRGVRAFVPGMLERGSGHVVNTASVAGTWAYTWDATPYITSKFAAYGYSEALMRSLKPRGIDVTVVCPGLVTTNLGESARQSGVPAGVPYFWFPPEMLADPKDPEDVGEQVLEAVEAKRFTVFTHPEDEARFKTWHQDIDASLAAAVESAPAPPNVR